MKDDNKFVVNENDTVSQSSMGVNEEYNSAHNSDFVIIDSENNYQYQEPVNKTTLMDRINAKVLLIIGLILLLLLIIWFVVAGYLKNQEYKDWLERIRIAAKQHVDSDDQARESIEDGNKENVYIFELTEGGHIANKYLVNPKTKKKINKCNYVRVSVDLNNKISYDEIVLNNTKCPILKPVIELKGELEIILEQGTAYVEPGATALDYDGTDLTSKIKIAGTVDVNKPGTYQVTYNVSNKKGAKASELARTIVIKEKPVVVVPPKVVTPYTDRTKPVIRATGVPQSISLGQTVNYTLVFSDNSRIKSITYCSNTCITESVNASSRTKNLPFYGGSVGSFKISASAVDTSGNTGYYEGYISVNTPPNVDTIAPVIYWENPVATVTSGSNIQFRIVFTDNVGVKNYHISLKKIGSVGDGLIDNRIVTPSTRVMQTINGILREPGNYSITASATDTSGNWSGNKQIGTFRVI